MEVKLGIKRNAVMCILKSKGQLLLLLRKKDPNKGTYTPIGGKLDPYENPNDTAIRETKEETGLEVNNYRYIGSLIETSPTKYNWNCQVYLAEIEYCDPPECDEGTLKWIPFSEILNVPTPPTDWFIYQYVLKGKPFCFNADFDENLNILRMREEIEGVELDLDSAYSR